MRAVAGVLVLLATASLHAAPDDVLVPNYAREEGWQWYKPECGRDSTGACARADPSGTSGQHDAI